MHTNASSFEFLSQHCVGYWTRKASRVLTRHYNAHFEPVGLTAAQFSVLVALAQNRDRTIVALAESLDADDTTVVRAIQALQKRGLVRAEGGRGRQTKRCQLTSGGRLLLKRGLLEWSRAYAEIEMQLGGRKQAAGMVRLLRRLVQSAQKNKAADPHLGTRTSRPVNCFTQPNRSN